MNKTLRTLGLGLTTLFALGCSASNLLEGAAKTTVTVTLDQAPVEDAAVVFTPIDGGRSASGRTDAYGVAEMGTSRVGDGVFPGDYKIVVVKSIDDPNFVEKASDEHEVRGRGGQAYAKQIYLIPEKYINTKTSGLSASIQPDIANEVTLDLNSK